MTGLEYAIRYDVEHDLFHPRNVFSDKYITPTFVDYVRKLEQKLEQTEKDLADYQFNYPKIKELEEENNKLLDVINNQDVKIADLEKQIEKMKCCDNCAEKDRYDFYDDTWHTDVCGNCKNLCNWKLKE